jgi:hypothetical protein
MIATPTQYPIDIRKFGDARTPGIHLSGILRPMAITLGHLEPDDIELDELIKTTSHLDTGNVPTLMRIGIGFAWEEWIAKHLPAEFHPGEFSHMGITCTPDGIQLRPGLPPLLHEIKATYKSAKRPFEDHKMWVWQAAGYLRIISEEFGEECTECVFHPLFLRGDYGAAFPLYRPVHVEFEWAEIESYWQMILANKHRAKPE